MSLSAAGTGNFVHDDAATGTANKRWPGFPASRLRAQSGGRRLGLVNPGIGGNRVLTATGTASPGSPGVSRFAHDVLGQPGVQTVIVLEGVNAINTSSATAAQITAGYQSMLDEARAAGVSVIGGTSLPHSSQSAAKAAMRDPANTGALLAACDRPWRTPSISPCSPPQRDTSVPRAVSRARGTDVMPNASEAGRNTALTRRRRADRCSA